MILTPEIEEKITSAIRANPDKPVILPDFAYAKDGRVIVLVDRLPIDLHRHLHNLLIRPLEHHERMHQREGVDPRNVNPHLFIVIAGAKSPATHCHKGHEYAGNEAPPNARGYRCLTCYRDYLASLSGEATGVANGQKTHCPAEHEYTPENTRINSQGRRVCLACERPRNAERMRKARAEARRQKESQS